MTRQTLRLLLGVGWSGITLMGLIPALLREPHTDEAWSLYLAGSVLEGARQGRDFLEVNPPLFIWKSIPAVVVSRVLGVSSWDALVIMLGLAATASALFASHLLRQVEPSPGRRGALGLIAVFSLLVLPRTDFSEREQLGLILTLPYVILIAVRSAKYRVPTAQAVITGGLAGIGFGFKPHFLVAWLLLEIYLLSRLGRRTFTRSELHGLVAFGLAYSALVLVFVPGYLPMALRLGPWYHAYMQRELISVIGLAGLPLLLIGGVAIAGRRPGSPEDRLRDAFSLAYAGFLLAAVIQQKGFPYHYIAAWGYGLLLLVRAWQTRPQPLSYHPSGIALRVGFALLGVVPIMKLVDATEELLAPDSPSYRYNHYYLSLLPVVRQLAAGEAITVFSTSPSAAWPLILEAEAQSALRYMSLWPLAALYHDQLWFERGMVQPLPPTKRTGFEREFMGEVIDDLAHRRPRLLMVLLPDSTLELKGASQRIDYLQYFAADPRFRSFLHDYREVTRVGPYSLWTRGEP